MAETALNFDKHNQYTKSYQLPEGFKEDEINKMKEEEKVSEKPEDLRDWIKKSVSGRKSVTSSGLKAAAGSSRTSTPASNTPSTRPTIPPVVINNNNSSQSSPRSPRGRTDSDDDFGGIETSLDDIFESISGKGGMPQKAGVNASSSSKTTRAKKPVIEYTSDSDDDPGTPRERKQPVVSTTFGNSPKTPSPRANLSESEGGGGSSKKSGLRRTNSYLQQREEVLQSVEAENGSGGEGAAAAGASGSGSGKGLKRTQSYLERREAELRRLSESRRGSLSTDSNDLSDFPTLHVSASNAASKNVSRVGSGDQTDWDAALKNSKVGESSSAVDPVSLGLKLASINNTDSSDDSTRESLDSPRALSTDSGDSGEMFSPGRRHSLPARPTSLKTDKSFKPQLQTIYSMRSEMDMNESMYLSNGNSLSNVGSKSNGSFYNSGSSSSREGLGGGPCAAANGLVPDGVNTSLAPSPTAKGTNSLPSPGRGTVAKPILRSSSFTGQPVPSNTPAVDTSALYKKAIRRSIIGEGTMLGGDVGPQKTAVEEEEPKIVYNAAKILRKTIMTHKNKDGEMVEATANDTEDESSEPLVEFVLEYHTLEYIQEKARQKEYEGLLKCQLEKHLSDEDFEKTFKMTFEKFYAMPAWKQMDQKKRHKIF